MEHLNRISSQIKALISNFELNNDLVEQLNRISSQNYAIISNFGDHVEHVNRINSQNLSFTNFGNLVEH